MRPFKPFVPPASCTEPETCPDCQGEIRVGDWPICKGDPTRHVPPAMAHRPFAAVVDDNLGQHVVQKDGTKKWVPAEITSQAQRRRLMKEQHKDYHGRRLGEPGAEF